MAPLASWVGNQFAKLVNIMDTVMEQELPARLYKYRAHNEFTEDIIQRNRVYLASPDDFNDPFDCKVPIRFEATKNELMDKWLRAARMMEPNTPLKQLRQRVKHVFNDPNYHKVMRQYMVKRQREHVTNFGIFCMAEKCDNILMWSHYSDSHRGLCLEFDTSLLAEYEPRRINYSDNYPKLNYFKSSDEDLDIGLIFSKSSAWAYENEWRICLSEVKERFLEFQEEFLTGIVFGCECANKTYDHYIRLCKGRKKQIKFRKAFKRPGAFALELRDV